MPTTVCRACGGASSPLRWACPCCVLATGERLDAIREHAVAVCAAGPVDGPARPGRVDAVRGDGLPVRVDDAALGDGDPAVVVLSVLDVLHRIARYVRRHRGEPAAFRCTITSEVAYLKANAEWCAHQLWGHDFVEAVHDLHSRTAERAGTLVR
ncbi:hypothetical protein ACFFQW_39555 [Umezawaea endophytica]|uniref:Uncharacterized protein n=1 Tax=Umezawaea endophytica TaxID=1654476 RepID=A0A9X2VMQ4_9PSEU|nr:hypothetical protein [Umezawaea endophytica]MCS7479538.1 hypothetical protein [Umezawaea endophytica]